MIIGHIGVALGARRRWPAVSFLALLVATFAPDLLREVLGLSMMPATSADFYSHALPWSALLAVGLGVVTWLLTRSREAALVIVAVVASHVALDLLSGTKPLWLHGPRGRGLGAFAPGEMLVETVILASGWLSVRRGGDRRRWFASRVVPPAMVGLQAFMIAGFVSQRPYAVRCLAHPVVRCDDRSWFRRRWETEPLWQ